MSPAFARSYSHPDDLPAMIDFLKSVRPAEWMHEYPAIFDLHEALGRLSIQEKTRLWFADHDRLTAFAFMLEPHNQLVFEIEPSHEGEIENDLIRWGMDDCPGNNRGDSLITSCREDDHRRVALLERQGFARLAGCSLQMARPLDKPIPPAQLPKGFSIRPVKGEQEVDEIVALHRAAFSASSMTRDERLAIMRAPEYDPTLDLIVIAPEGQFAAYCTCSISSAENRLTGRKVGHTDPVASHPEYQRRGLARALLLTGAHLLRERGMDLAVLGTEADNLAMQAAARSAGFAVYSKRIWFAKPIFHA